MSPDPARTLEDCPAVIFIAYTVPDTAEPNGYSDWLRRVDMPFFNAIPGTRHYANWRIASVEKGDTPVWDYFDFQGLESENDLDRVWFSPDLDGFRKEWLRLWGYGRGEAPPVLRHAYLMRPSAVSDRRSKDTRLSLCAGTGPAPALGEADIVWTVDSVLHKHFGGTGDGKPWNTPAAQENPLGLDWIAIRHGDAGLSIDGTILQATADLIAAPDR